MRWLVALALFVISVSAQATDVCVEPAARSTLVDMVANHGIEQALPPGWSLSHVDAGRSEITLLLQAPDHSPRALRLVPTEGADQPFASQISPGTPDAYVLHDLAAAISSRMPSIAVGPCDGPPPRPQDTGPAPWSRARALFVGAIAALSVLGALVFVLIQ